MPETTYDTYKRRYTVEGFSHREPEADPLECELLEQIAEQKKQLAKAEAELAAAEAEHPITLK